MSARWRVEGLETRVEGFRLGPIDLALSDGSGVAVLGPSGSGKTTLLRTLAGFLRPSAGRLLRDGVDISDWPPEQRALGYVPQGLGLFPHLTVERNVRYPLDMRRRPDAAARARELMEKFRLLPLARRRPARLSGGEQQRVAIARALAAEPELIVWDEPWQGLDVLARYELGLALHEVRVTERVPLLVVTHDPALAFSVADSFLVLRAGRTRTQGDAGTLLDRPADAFAARFVGLENVYEPDQLAGGRDAELRSWLRARAGPEGIAFPAPAPSAPAAASGPWTGRVRSARPSPGGVQVEVESDELMVVLRLAGPVRGALPTLGEPIAFDVGAGSLRPLGGDAGAPPP